jgi:hypothetical protein
LSVRWLLVLCIAPSLAAQPAASPSSPRWRPAATGVEWAEQVIHGRGEAWRTRVVVARVDPARVALRLDTAFTAPGRMPAWTAEAAADAARAGALLLAVNAGQFAHARPWGRVVLDGRASGTVGSGSLVSTLAVDADGAVRLLHGDSLARTPARWAFQSYPTLLAGGVVPAPLRVAGTGLDVAHRDARAAVGLDDRGRLLVAITRFDALGAHLGFIPFGLTVPEMAAVMGALGARDAVMLDGGISAQMVLRGAADGVRTWPGLRAVPLALVAAPRR